MKLQKNKNDKTLIMLSEALRAMAHPERLKILLQIMQHGKKRMTVTELHQKLGLTQPETSRHLAILKNKNILVSEKSGSHIYYFLNEDFPELNNLVKCIVL